MGSDGLFDNLFGEEIISVVYRFEDVTSAAKALADLAGNHLNDVDFESPYSIEARSRYTLAMIGYDDEYKSTVLELTYNYGVTEYTKGNAYAQIAIGTEDVYKGAEAVDLVTKELGGKITRQPGPIPVINTKITSFLDPDGWKTLVGRTDNDIKNFWNLRIRRQKCVRPSSNPPQPDDDVNQPVPSSTTTNDNTETSWPVTQPQPPMYYYNPGPSSETASRIYPLMVRPLQVDRSACGPYTSVHSSSTPSHQYRPLLAYGISEPHVQGNQLPYTEVMPNYRDLPYHEPGSEYQFEGDRMSTVTDPTVSLTQNYQWWAPQNTDSVIDRHHQQQQRRQEQRLSYMVPDTTPNNYTMMSWPVTGLQPPTDYYNDGLSSVTASRGYPSMPKPFQVYRSARRLNTSVPSSNASPYVISELNDKFRDIRFLVLKET